MSNKRKVGNRWTAGSRQWAVGSMQLAFGIWHLIVLSILLTACGKALPDLVGINISEWENDKNGCNGSRKEVMEKMIAQKDQLLSLTEMDMTSLIGKPDQTELYKRSEKFYKYYFHNGPGCPADSIQPKAMIIRFNAMGLAKEVVVE